MRSCSPPSRTSPKLLLPFPPAHYVAIGTLLNWLLDVWTEPKRGQHLPFGAPACVVIAAEVTPEADTQRFLKEFQLLLNVVEEHEEVYGVDECHLALTVATHAETPTFFLVSDDEQFDFACVANAGAIERLRCRLGHLNVGYESGTRRVELNYFPEDGEEEPPEQLVRAVRRTVRCLPWSRSLTKVGCYCRGTPWRSGLLRQVTRMSYLVGRRLRD